MPASVQIESLKNELQIFSSSSVEQLAKQKAILILELISYDNEEQFKMDLDVLDPFSL